MGFQRDGTVQAFEANGTYSARRVRDRFTSEMLDGPDTVFFESIVPMPAGGMTMTLAEAQKWLENRSRHGGTLAREVVVQSF
jgi:hypothetical protein